MENKLISHQPSFLDPIQEELNRVQKLILSELKDCQPDIFSVIQRTLFAGGKQIRPAIVLFIGNALQGPQDDLIRLAAAIELLHNATLIHDDLIDHTTIRHAQPTIHTTHSPQLTVLIGDYLFAHAAKMASEIDSQETAKIFANTLINIINGEIAQYSEDKRQSNLMLYEKRIYQKTASLFEASALLACDLCSSSTQILESMRKFGYHAGMAFQMMDDVLDFIGKENVLGKPIGNDLRQGLLNLPTILYLADHPDSPFTTSILEGTSFNDESCGKKILEAIQESAAINTSLQLINHHLTISQQQIEMLPESNGRQSLREMIIYLSRRVH